jgi:hypothetical protein
MFENFLVGEAESIISQQTAKSHTHTYGVWTMDHLIRSKIFGQFSKTKDTEKIFNSYTYINKPKKEEHRNNLADAIINIILHDIRDAKDNFDDLRYRQVFFHKAKTNINNLWDYVSEMDCSENLVMLLVDCVENLKAENILYEQLNCIEEVIQAISRGNITEDKLDYYMDALMEKDIPLVRLPKNISDLYD